MSLLERALKKSDGRAPRETGVRRLRHILDRRCAESVKNTDTAGQKGQDAGKKVSGIKRHIAVDTQAWPQAIAVTTAEATDRKGALQVLERCKPNLKRVRSLLCDGGYSGAPSAEGARNILGEPVTVQIASAVSCTPSKSCPSAELSNAVSLGWRKTGDSGKTCERLLNTCLQFVHLAFLTILPRRS